MKIFIEEQRFTQIWLFIVLGFSLVVPIYVMGKEFLNENSKMSVQEFTITLLGILASVGIIFIFKLKTRIDEIGIHYQFFPIHFSYKTIPWQEIENAHVRTYDPIGEYGGWGFKGGAFWNKKKGKCINISGDIGIQLKLNNGKKLLIGTQKKEEAMQVLKRYTEKVNLNEPIG
ncbi:hypothetical protein [uncultured Polaribacter sp.]|uniref:hypothetical protein n=1 Tax=uncultured Polaribacter sp. TaxID=174711 RepID=UPI0026176D9F|nr:hypothetical protein [uncultured Polaribacter sp.]